MDSRSNTTMSPIFTPRFRCTIVFTGELSFALNPVGSELRNAVVVVPSRAINHRWSHLSIMDVIEDIPLGIEGMGTLPKFYTDTLAVIFINVTSMHNILFVRRLAGSAWQ